MNAGVPLALAGLFSVLGLLAGHRNARLWLALTVAAAASGLVAALAVLSGAPIWAWWGTFAVGGESPHLQLDALSSLFLALLALVGGLGAVYASAYWSDRAQSASAARGRMGWSALTLAMGLVLIVANGLHFLLVWELFALAAYFLITLDRRRAEVRRAGWLYLVASHAGTLFLFAFFVALALRTGGWDLGPVRDRADLAPLFWLAFIGFGLKAGLFPLHIWLPSAHANAPSHVSAIMSGVAIKMGLYGILRFSGWLPVPAAAGWVIIGLGAVSALLGIVFAFAQNDLKRLLAYCSVENMGVMHIGLGAALLAQEHGDASWGRLALAGALLHVWNHGVFKSLLFLGAGSVLHAAGTREMSRLGGLWRSMPWTAALFAVGAAAVSSLPPLNGFVSEWLIYLGLFDAVGAGGLTAWAAGPAVLLLALTGAFALAGFVKASSIVFLGAPRTKPAAHAHESPLMMRLPMLVLALLCVALGATPTLLWPALNRAMAAWNPAADLTVASAPAATLGLVNLALVALLALLATLLLSVVRSRGVRRAVTWDCGYERPSAHMQYTSGSFAGIGTGWFAWILQPVRVLRRPRGPLPETARHVERTPETVLERILAPVADVVLRASRIAGLLQHGRLQVYILYVVAGLVAVGTLVLLGARP